MDIQIVDDTGDFEPKDQTVSTPFGPSYVAWATNAPDFLTSSSSLTKTPLQACSKTCRCSEQRTTDRRAYVQARSQTLRPKAGGDVHGQHSETVSRSGHSENLEDRVADPS